MKNLSAKAQISLGLSFLVASIVLSAAFLGLIPDRISAIREGRAALAEAMAITGTTMITQGNPHRFEAVLRTVVKRNPDILSAALRRANGELVVTVGDHARNWVPMPDEHSTDTQMQVPIWEGANRWGRLEFRCRPLAAQGILAYAYNPTSVLIAFLFMATLVAFYFYLAKVLRHLDPSQAIPGRVRAALDSLAEGLLVIDKKQTIVLVNQAFSTFLGKRPEELVGHSAAELEWRTADGRPADANELPWLTALKMGTEQHDDMLNLYDTHAREHNFIVNCSPVLSGSGRATGVLISINDVTQLEQNKIELHRAKDDAESANRAKSEFLANMSHEIRTPMNAILGFTELLQRGYSKNERDAAKFLNTIHSSGKHLLGLINDILDLSKVEAGRMEVERIPCAPHRVIRDVVTVLAVKAREKGIGLEFLAEGPIPSTVLTDPGRLRQITTNLLGNAIKFTEHGSVKVVMGLKESDGEPLLVMKVIDSGIGIPVDKLDSIFDPFVQADTTVTRRFGGTGLGLSISRKFARALGGNIVATSEPGKGSTFLVTLAAGPLDGIPLMEPGEALAGTDEAGAQGQFHWQFSNARVLVVDDGPENRELVTLVLEENGIYVEQAENGKVGVDKVLAGQFDVVLMDMHMPVMDGQTATRTIRGHGLSVPIIALTAHAMKGFEQEIIAAGCTGYVTKPIDIDTLMRALAETLGGQRVADTSSATPEATPPEAPSLTEEAPLVSRLADKPRLLPAIRKFTGRLKEQLDAMENAHEKGDFQELAGLAHWLKGAGGTVGYDAFTEPAAELEQAAKAGNLDESRALLSRLHKLSARIAALDEVPAPAPLKVSAHEMS